MKCALRQLRALRGIEEGLYAALRRQSAVRRALEHGVDVGVAGAVEAERPVAAAERLGERRAEALVAHVQAGGKPGGYRVFAEHVLDL